MKKQQKKNTATKNVIVGVVAWVLSFLLIILTVLSILVCTLGNRNYMYKQVMKSGFVSQALNQLNENYKSYGTAGNIPESVMVNIVTEEQIQKDMFRAVDGLYDGDRRLIAHSEVAQKAKEAITENLQQREVQITEDIEQGIQDMANGCQADYDSYVQLVITPYVAHYVPKLSKLILLGTVMFVFLALAAAMILFSILRTGKERLRWYIHAFSAAALFSVILPVLFNRFIQMKYLNLKPETLKLLLTSYTHNAVGLFYIAALVHLVIVIVLAVIWKSMGKKKTVR